MKNRIFHQHTNHDSDYVDLRSILHGVIEKKWVILIFSLTLCIATTLYAELKPIKYQASILLKIQHDQHNILGSITNPNQQLGLANRPQESLAVQIALIQSEFILRPVIKSLGLDIHVTPNKSTMMTYLFNPGIKLVKISNLQLPIKYIEKPLRLVIENNKHFILYTENGDELIQGFEGQAATHENAIAIKVDSIKAPPGSQFTVVKDQEFELLKKIRSNLLITELSGSLETDTNKIAILRIALTGTDPENIARILNQISTTTQQENMRLKAAEADKALTFLYQQLPIVKESLKNSETKLNIYRAASGKADVKFQTQYLLSHLSDINKDLEKLNLKKSTLLQDYTPNHPLIISLNNEIRELDKNRDQLNAQLKTAPIDEQEYLNLEREVNVKNNLYMLLLNQIHQLAVIKKGISSDIQILSPASAPYIMQPVKLSLISFFSLLTGLILGSLAVILWRTFSQKIAYPNWNENTKITTLRQHGSTS